MINTSTYAERLLFGQIAGGDESAFRQIFDQYRVGLFNIAIRLTRSQLLAEEITQEVFIALWVSRAQLVKVEQPGAYLHRMLFNKVNEYLKKEANQDRIIKDALQYKQLYSNSTEELLDVNDRQRVIEQALGQMPDQQKLVYRLSRQQGLSTDEIAQRLAISPHTVKSHLAKALKFIRLYLEGAAIVAALYSGISDLHPF